MNLWSVSQSKLSKVARASSQAVNQDGQIDRASVRHGQEKGRTGYERGGGGGKKMDELLKSCSPSRLCAFLTSRLHANSAGERTQIANDILNGD